MPDTSTDLDEITRDNGYSFEEWMTGVNRAYGTKLGFGPDDLGDAPFHDYYNDGMSPLDAMAHALHDWQDEAGMLDLDDLGLAGRV